MPKTPPNEADQVTLWFCHLIAPIEPQLIERYESWLSESEITKVARFRQQDARDKGLLVRAALRQVLSQYANIPQAQWQFEYGDKGKPRLCCKQRLQTGIEFNLSHSGEWLVIAVCQTRDSSLQLGVDIERYREKTNIYPILNHYFCHFEIDDLMALDEGKRRDRFFDLWALKESYIKAKGLGLALNLKSFQFDFKSQENCTLELKGRNSVSLLPLYQHIELATVSSASSEDLTPLNLKGWQVNFGRLDERYRFALCLDREISVTNIKANLLDMNAI